jgi:type I restriction-modification system DNA methylase subunit
MNERKTEQIVRRYFEKFPDVIVEEQRSDNAKIQKLLATASKAGNGLGQPDFIIQYPHEPGFIIVIECKAEVGKHESLSRNQYKDYAVDGVLLYSAHLAKDYDVLAIAVSGQQPGKLKISHFLQLKGETKPIPTFADTMLPPQDYLEGYIKTPEKFRQDYERLLEFARELNETLQMQKIVESDRGLLLSCILIALENKGFAASYSSYNQPKQLSDYLVATVQNEFENGNIDKGKLDVLRNRFAFISTDTTLSEKKNILREIIDDVDKNVKSFIKTHQYFDVLGQLYIEFLSYANADKGLGIVLTPPHITDFMAQIAEVNKDSIVYDNCTGTGGFLVAAMRQMIFDAKGNQKKIQQIKQNQLIGVEYQAHIFALACSNMFIHQDGKTNILKGSCFENEIKRQAKTYRPNVGLLNPPFKVNKRIDTDEYEFVMQNLECLEQGGKCVAVLPMSKALATNGIVADYKKELLAKHTLEAVFSMPNELFHNADAGTVVCIMVFTAKRPHPKSKEVYFGYYKNDGFVKIKHQGRIDLYGEFASRIKDEWTSYFVNRKAQPGLSVCKTVTEKDEWCAESYMETDYTLLRQETFEHKIRDYVAYRTRAALSNSEESIWGSRLSEKQYQLDAKNWQWFNLPDLFSYKRGKRLTKPNRIEGTIPLVTAGFLNEGVNDYISNDVTVYSHAVTIDMFGTCCYRGYSFACDDNILVLFPKNKIQISKYASIFLSVVIEADRYKYAYGRQYRQKIFDKQRIQLPVKPDGTPDWQFMEDFIKSLPFSGNL